MTLPVITPEMRTFLTERHLASLTTLRRDGSPHVVPVGFSYDEQAGIVRVITFPTSVKYKNACRGGRAVVSQVDGGRWLSLEGLVTGTSDAHTVQIAVAAYTTRYSPPKERPERVVIEIAIDRIMGRA